MPFSFLNGLSAMGQGIATFAGQAGLEAQKSDLAQAQMRLADSLATTRETGLENLRQTGAAALQGGRQEFEAGQGALTRSANVALENLREAGATGRTQAEIAARAAEAEKARKATMDQLQFTASQPTTDIKSAQEFSKLSPEDKQAYREQIATKAGMPMWMISPDVPSSPKGTPGSIDTTGAGATGTEATGTGGTGTTGTSTGTGSTGAGGTGAGGTGAGGTGTAPKGTKPAGTGPTVAAPDTSTGPYRNDKALEGLPGPAADIVKGMVDGRISPPSSFAMAKPYWQGLVAKAAEYDPTFDQTTWAGRVATRKDFAAGQSARAITAMNTALGHAGLVADSLAALHNGWVKPWNAFVNWGHDQLLGDAGPTNAREAIDALASEARRVFSGTGGGNLTELQEWQKNFPINGSRDQQEGALRTFVTLMDSRLQALGDQYNRGMGRADEPIRLLNDHAREVYDRLTSGHPLTKSNDQTGPGDQTGRAPASAAVPKPPTAPAVPSWVRPGDQYSPSRGQARGADGAVYGPPS